MAKSRVLLLTLALILTLSAPSLAQFDLKTQLTYGGTNYSDLLKEDQSGNTTEWSIMALGTYTYQDLLFNVSYQHGKELNMKVGPDDDATAYQHQRSHLQLGANYHFLEETGMDVYGGLGYSLMWLNMQHPKIRVGNAVSFAGHGFAAQAVVQFELADKFTADAFLTAAPWFVWRYTEASKENATTDSTEQIGGSVYNYQLGLEYEVAPEYSVRLGIFGGSYRIDDFKFLQTQEIGPTRAGNSGVTVGVTWHF